MLHYDDYDSMSAHTLDRSKEEDSSLAALSEQPTRPERSGQLSRSLKRLRTVLLVAHDGSARETGRARSVQNTGRQHTPLPDTHRYEAAIWGARDGNGVSEAVVVEQREFPGANTGEMLEMAALHEMAASWQWIYDGGDDGSDGSEDLDASANVEGSQGPYPQTGPLPIILEPARGRRTERLSGARMASSMLPLLVTLLIIGIVGALVCQYLLAFYR